MVKVVTGGDDLASICDDWTMGATATDGSPIRRAGRAIEAVGRFVCDDPFARG